MEPRTLLGSQLAPRDQTEALRLFVNRYTGEHVPQWAKALRHDGTRYPLQFADDAEWLAHTRFCVRKDGRLDMRYKACESSPTWPNNPELRKEPN